MEVVYTVGIEQKDKVARTQQGRVWCMLEPEQLVETKTFSVLQVIFEDLELYTNSSQKPLQGFKQGLDTQLKFVF